MRAKMLLSEFEAVLAIDVLWHAVFKKKKKLGDFNMYHSKMIGIL